MKSKENFYKKVSLFLDFLFTVPGHIFFVFVLLCMSIFMYINSTYISSPELREYALSVDKRTTSSKDTLNAIFVECLFDVDSLYADGEFIDSYKSVISYNLSYKLHGITGNIMDSVGLQIPRKVVQKGTNNVLMEFKWFKQIIFNAFGHAVQGPQYISFPDSQTQMIVTNIQDQQNFLLCRTVPYGDMQMNAYFKDGMLTSHKENNPYIIAFFRFDFGDDVIDLEEKSAVYIKTGSRRDRNNKLKNPINYTNIWPMPDKVTPDLIAYNTNESVINAIQNGVYISAENINVRKKSDRRTFLYTLFLGIFITMLIELIISLTRKWKDYMHKYYNNANTPTK